MRAKWLRAACLSVVVAACGNGEAIFNIDVYSFIKGTAQDTIPYFVLSGSLDTSSAPQLIRLLGAGSSVVDSVLIGGTDTVQSQSGSGTIAFKLYLAADSAGTRLPSALALSVPAGTVGSAADTISCPPRPASCLLFSSANPLFAKDSVWARIAVTASNTGATPFAGKIVITSLVLSVFINDKIF